MISWLGLLQAVIPRKASGRGISMCLRSRYLDYGYEASILQPFCQLKGAASTMKIKSDLLKSSLVLWIFSNKQHYATREELSDSEFKNDHILFPWAWQTLLSTDHSACCSCLGWSLHPSKSSLVASWSWSEGLGLPPTKGTGSSDPR